VVVQQKLLPRPNERSHRVQLDPEMVLDRNDGYRIDDGGQKEQGLEKQGDQPFQVTDEYVDRGDRQRRAVYREELSQYEKGYARYPLPGWSAPIPQQHEERDRNRQQEMDRVAQNAADDDDVPREPHLLDQRRVVDEGHRAAPEGASPPPPRRP